jgi:hypothetical protein
MAGYSRTNTSDIQSGETVKSAPLNAELNALQTAFAVSGGHKHDGSTEGAFIGLMSDADNDTKIQLEESSDEDIIRFDIAGTEQIVLADGVLKPTTDNDIDLGTSSLEFKNAFFDGTVTTDILAVGETTTLTGAVTLGNILSIPDGSASAPSITNTGDTNVGLFFSANDTLAFTAGGTSQFTMADGAISPVTDGDIDLGTTNLRFETGFFDNLTVTTTVASAGSLSAGTTISAGGTITSTGTLIASNNATVGGTLVSTGKITADAGIDIDNFNIDGTTIALSSGNMTLDAAGDIVLDADGGDVTLKDGGTTFGSLTNTSGDLIIKSGTTTAATFDGGNVTFAGTLAVGGHLSVGDNDLQNVGNIALDSITADGSAITITGNTTFADGSFDFDIASHDTSNGLKLGGTLVTATAAELNIMDGVTSTAAELNTLDGVTAVVGELNALDLGSTAIGTAIASKAVVLDANKDYTGIRNFTITGDLTVGGTQTVVDTVTMNAQNAIVFEGATADDHETTLTIVDPTADRTINLPNQSGTIPVLAAASNTAITSTPEELNILDGATVTVTELNIMDGGTSATSTTVADADRVVFNDAGTMKQVAMTDMATYIQDKIQGGTSIVTTGALNTGSITSGFGTIDTGSSAITTTGTINFGNLSDGSITIAGFKDEDDMASNSATHVPTQQSVLAYITATMGSVSSAAASATAAAASLDSFDDVYLGTKSSAPSVDNDGDALATGSLYFNSQTNVLNVRTSAGGWTNAGSSVNGTSSRESFVVGTNSTNSAGVSYSGSTTSFPISYDAGFVDVYLNGVKLKNATDVTVTSGSAVVLASAAAAGDILDAVGYGTFELADHYSKTAADARFAQLSGATFTGNVSAGSNNLTATGTVSLGATSFNDQNITNVGNIALDSITADGSAITITGNTTFADGSFDFNVASHDGTNGLALGGTVVTASAAELNYVDGVTSAIQTQLDAKSPLASPTFTGDVTLTGGTSGRNVIFDASDNSLEFADNAKAVFGTGADMEIYHDATNSYIANKTGALKIATETSGIAVTIGHTTSEVTVADNLTITGDLTVNGATTTVATTNTTVADHLIKLGQGYTGSANDQGFIVTRGNGSASNTANKGFIWDESADEFATIAGNTEAGTTTGNVTINDYANLHVGALVADDSVSIGGTTITSTAAELNILDGVTASAADINLIDGITNGTVIASKAIITDANKDISGGRNITISGELDAATGDFSGAVDVAGAFTNGSTLVSTGKITADAGIDIDNFNIDGTTIALSSGDMTLDAAGNITLDADGGNVRFKDGGTEYGTINKNGTANLSIYSSASDADLLLQGNDGGSVITALTLDMSDGGTALFNSHVRLGDDKAASFGAGNDIEIASDGTNGTIAAPNGNLTVDVAGEINIDSATGVIRLKDGGTQFGAFIEASNAFVVKSQISDGDLKLMGVDGGSEITACIFDMSAAGAATFNNNVTAFSDRRLKSDIQTIENGLEKVEQLRGVTYTRDDNVDGGQQLGVIAQEVEEVFPQVVLTAKDERGTKSVDYGRLTGALIEAVKELSAKVKELEGRLDASS